MDVPPTVEATRYAAPLREGGSLPALVEADDDGLYVLKFHGAGQGPRSLIAELVAGEIGRAIGPPVPVTAFVTLDRALGRRSASNACVRSRPAPTRRRCAPSSRA